MQDYRDCTLCPRRCHADRMHGDVGLCGHSSDARIARCALHHWEEPPISGTGGSGTIFLSGCSLGCIYCQNHSISHKPMGDEASSLQIADKMLALQSEGALNINFVTPTHFAPTLRDAISIARSNGLTLPIVWNTSGYETMESIDSNQGLIDIYLTDLKYFDRSIAERYSKAPDYFEVAIDALAHMLSTTCSPSFDFYNGSDRLLSGVVVRHMVLPGEIEDSMRILKELYERFGNDILYSIMNQYTPVLKTLADGGSTHAINCIEKYPALARSVTEEEYESVLDYADKLGIVDYFWQDGLACQESFIPPFTAKEPQEPGR